MRYRHIHANYYAGIDVHPRRSQVCVMDQTGQIMMNRNFKNDFSHFKQMIEPFKIHIAVGCESTYTYYWLADGCRQSDIPFYLSGPCIVYEGHQRQKTKKRSLGCKDDCQPA